VKKTVKTYVKRLPKMFYNIDEPTLAKMAGGVELGNSKVGYFGFKKTEPVDGKFEVQVQAEVAPTESG
jgi:hypothetical protein